MLTTSCRRSCSQDHTRTPSRTAPPRGLRFGKDGVHHGGAAEQVDQRYEGMAVSLVCPGLQRRLTVILYGKSFSTLSIFVKYVRLDGH